MRWIRCYVDAEAPVKERRVSKARRGRQGSHDWEKEEEMSANNKVYEGPASSWWDDDDPFFSILRFFVSPVRFLYFKSVLEFDLRLNPRGVRLLDVGCGGGFLSEDFAAIGLSVTGIDPSPSAIEAARAHGEAGRLAIDYRVGRGDALPFDDGSFTLVSCCDTLEHVDDPDRIIMEIARVLKPGGALLFHTINRTFVSRIVAIKAMQEWKSTAFVGPGAYEWKKFIRPAELRAMMERHGLTIRGTKGISSASDPFSSYLNLVRAKKGKIPYREAGRRMMFRMGKSLMNHYMGYGVKEYRS